MESPPQKNIKKVERVQRRAARWVKHNYSPYESVTNMVDILGWRTLEQRRADTRLILFYKIVHSLVAVHIPNYFEQLHRLTRTMHPFPTDKSIPAQTITNIHFPHDHYYLEQTANRCCQAPQLGCIQTGSVRDQPYYALLKCEHICF